MNFTIARILSVVGAMFLLGWSAHSTAAPDSNTLADASATQDVSLKVGESFLRARSRIIKSGWKPIRMHQNDGYEYSGTDRLLAERNIVEVDGCSTDAGVLCIFYYQKVGKCLRIDTVGENVAQIIVTRWSNECPDNNQ